MSLNLITKKKEEAYIYTVCFQLRLLSLHDYFYFTLFININKIQLISF
jgi:hypothetical protein